MKLYNSIKRGRSDNGLICILQELIADRVQLICYFNCLCSKYPVILVFVLFLQCWLVFLDKMSYLEMVILVPDSAIIRFSVLPPLPGEEKRVFVIICALQNISDKRV